MKTALIILSSLTLLMALSELICGLWLQSHGADASNIAFHSQLGIGTVVMVVVTLVALLVYVLKH